MKKLFLFAVTAAILTLTMSQSTKPPTRRLSVTLNDQTWDVILYVIDNSNVSHATVKAIRDSLFMQFSDTIKNPLRK